MARHAAQTGAENVDMTAAVPEGVSCIPEDEADELMDQEIVRWAELLDRLK